MIVLDNDDIIIDRLEIMIDPANFMTNCYVILDKATNKTAVIDPAFNAPGISENIKKLGGVLDKVLITHAHADHICALAELANGTNVQVLVHELDYNGLYDDKINVTEMVGVEVAPVEKAKVKVVHDKDLINIGNTTLEVIHTPGHTAGSICFFDEKNNVLYSGDTIFEKAYGRTDLLTGSHDDMKKSLDNLFERFENLVVMSGHGNIFELANSKRKIKLLFAFKG